METICICGNKVEMSKQTFGLFSSLFQKLIDKQFCFLCETCGGRLLGMYQDWSGIGV